MRNSKKLEQFREQNYALIDVCLCREIWRVTANVNRILRLVNANIVYGQLGRERKLSKVHGAKVRLNTNEYNGLDYR